MDDQSSAIIASSIGEIIRLSTDDEFRRTCYKMLNVSNTNECQIKIHEKLREINRKHLMQKTNSVNINTENILQISNNKRKHVSSFKSQKKQYNSLESI